MYSNSMWLRRTGGPCNSRQFDKAFRIFEGHFYESRVSWSMQKRPSQLMYFSDFSGLNLESGVSRLLLLWRQSRVAASRKVFEDEKNDSSHMLRATAVLCAFKLVEEKKKREKKIIAFPVLIDLRIDRISSSF